MPTYIDESGDTGTRAGSTPHFRLAAVFFQRVEHLDQFSDCLSALRSELRLPQAFEFHFAKIGHSLRTAFFQTVATMPFSFVVSSFDKLAALRPRLNKETIHEETAKGLIKHLEVQYLLAESDLEAPRGLKELVIFDRCDDPKFERVLKDEFKRLTAARPCGRRLVRGLRSGKSHSEPGIQLVDMICGATGKYLDGQGDYFNLLREKRWAIEEVK